MIEFNSEAFSRLVAQSAGLRGSGRFREAAALLEGSLPEMHADCLTNAYLEIFYAYKEAGDRESASRYARLLYQLDPGLPSIQEFMQ